MDVKDKEKSKTNKTSDAKHNERDVGHFEQDLGCDLEATWNEKTTKSKIDF